MVQYHSNKSHLIISSTLKNNNNEKVPQPDEITRTKMFDDNMLDNNWFDEPIHENKCMSS